MVAAVAQWEVFGIEQVGGMKQLINFLAWTGRAALEIDIPDDTKYQFRLRVAVEIAVKSGADLSRANLSEAYLSRANLSGANLSGANLSGADLYGADLSRANLSGADLYVANLSEADLSGADLSRANLSEADLSRANLSGANLSGADLYGARNVDSLSPYSIVPEVGSFTAFKKVRTKNGCAIATLEIPSEARRVSTPVGRKCRAEFARVVKIERNGVEITEAYSSHVIAFKYRTGETVTPDSFDPNPLVECSNGIHFFISRKEAEEY
jgi:hypothetical protein